MLTGCATAKLISIVQGVNEIRHTEVPLEDQWYIEGMRSDNDEIDPNAVEYFAVEILSPIPLTAEILKKNGFVEFIPHNWQIVIDNIMIEIRESEHNMAIWLDWNEHNTGTYASYIFPGPNCVHELQHALRMCGIDKEIEL